MKTHRYVSAKRSWLVLCCVSVLTIAPVAVLGAAGNAEDQFFEEAVSQIDGQEVINRAEIVRPRRMAFLFDASAAEFSEFDRLMVYNSILTAIFDANPQVVILESLETSVPPTFEDRQQLARQIDADSWVLVMMNGTFDNVSFYTELFDLLTLETFGDKTIDTGLRLDYRVLSRGFWDDLKNGISENFEGVVDRQDVKITALPGTEILGISDPAIVIPEGGPIEISLQSPAVYTFKAKLPGYYSLVDNFYLGYDAYDLDVNQKKKVVWGAELGLNNLQFLDLQGFFFIIPADFFVRLGFTTYALGIYFINDGLYLFRSNPLSTVQLHLGYYFFESQSFLRLYAAMGIQLRIEHREERFGLDTTAPAALSFASGLEYSFPGRGFRLFVEYNPLLYFPKDVEKFRQASFPSKYIGNENKIPGFLFTDNVAFSYTNFVVGVRYFF